MTKTRTEHIIKKTKRCFKNRIGFLIKMKKKIIKWIICHGIVCIILLFLIFVYKCPTNYFLNIPCLGCGITRAYISALHCDFKAAFKYHPLFFVVAPTILYIAHRNILKKRLPGHIEVILLCITLFLFVAVYIVKLVSKYDVAN